MTNCDSCDICCCPCHRGPRGPQGFPGLKGEKGDTGDQGPAGEIISAFGGLNNNGSQLVFFNAVDAPVKIKLDTQLPSFGINYENNTITIQKTGIYEITYDLLVSANQEINIYSAVRKNEEIITATRCSHTLYMTAGASSSVDGRLSTSTLVELEEGDSLDLIVAILRTLPTGLVMVVNGNANATMTVKLLKPTTSPPAE